MKRDRRAKIVLTSLRPLPIINDPDGVSIDSTVFYGSGKRRLLSFLSAPYTTLGPPPGFSENGRDAQHLKPQRPSHGHAVRSSPLSDKDSARRGAPVSRRFKECIKVTPPAKHGLLRLN